jgi:hypothetical protein
LGRLVAVLWALHMICTESDMEIVPANSFAKQAVSWEAWRRQLLPIKMRHHLPPIGALGSAKTTLGTAAKLPSSATPAPQCFAIISTVRNAVLQIACE